MGRLIINNQGVTVDLTDQQMTLMQIELNSFIEEIDNCAQMFDDYPRQALQDILRNITSLQHGIEFMLMKMNQKETA